MVIKNGAICAVVLFVNYGNIYEIATLVSLVRNDNTLYQAGKTA